MNVYKLHAYFYHFGLEVPFLSETINCYFLSLDLALAYLSKYCYSGLPWCVELYDGFMPVRIVARSSYAE